MPGYFDGEADISASSSGASRLAIRPSSLKNGSVLETSGTRAVEPHNRAEGEEEGSSRMLRNVSLSCGFEAKGRKTRGPCILRRNSPRTWSRRIRGMSAKLLDKRPHSQYVNSTLPEYSGRNGRRWWGVRKFHVSVYKIHGSLGVVDKDKNESKEEEQREQGEDLFCRYGVCRCRRLEWCR